MNRCLTHLLERARRRRALADLQPARGPQRVQRRAVGRAGRAARGRRVRATTSAVVVHHRRRARRSAPAPTSPAPTRAERFDVRALDAANRIIRAVVGLHQAGRRRGQRRRRRRRLLDRAGRRPGRGRRVGQLPAAFARIGLMPDGGTSATVAAAIGRARAMRMALLAEPLTAARGATTPAWSATSRRTRSSPPWSRAGPPAARGAPLAQAATKKAVNAATLAQLEAALERERTGQRALLRTARRRRGDARVRRAPPAGLPRRVSRLR